MEDILFIVSSGKEDTDIAQLVHHVLDESSNTYPQLSKVRTLQISLQRMKLQDWSCWLAIEVVNQWLNLPSIGISVDAVVEKLGLAPSEYKIPPLLVALNAGIGGTSLSSELLSRINSIRDRYNQLNYSYTELQQWLEQETIELSNWFDPSSKTSPSKDAPLIGVKRIPFNAEALQIRNQLYLKEALVSWRQAGLQSTLQFLQALGEKLTQIYSGYDQQRQTFQSKEVSAWRAFDNLRVQLQQHGFLGRKRQVTFDAVLQGLLKAYSFKLEAEVYSQACQLVGQLRQQIHLLAVEFFQAKDFLSRLKDEFEQQSPNEPFLAPLLKEYLTQRLDPIKFRREIEGVLGHPLNHWGDLRQSQEAIVRYQILSQLTPLCLEVYTQCYANIMSLKLPNSQSEPIDENTDWFNSIDFLDGSQK